MICNKTAAVAIVALLALLNPGPVLASNYTGLVQGLRFGNPTSFGPPARLSVFTTIITDCGGSIAYAFENSDTSLVQLMANALTAALTQGKTVFIQGSGACDEFGIETIINFQVQGP